MLRVMCGIVVLAIGVLLREKVKKRYIFFDMMRSAMMQAYNHIIYTKMPLKQVYKVISCEKNDIFDALANSCLGKEDIEKIIPEYVPCEEKFFSNLFFSLGKNDILGEQNVLNMYRSLLDEKVAYYKSQYEKYGKLYIQLSICSAIVLMVMLT